MGVMPIKRKGFVEPTETEAQEFYSAGWNDGLEGRPMDKQRSSMAPARSSRARCLAMLYVRGFNMGRQERMQRIYGDPA